MSQQKSDQATLSSLQLSNFGEANFSLFFLFVVEMSGTQWGLLLL